MRCKKCNAEIWDREICNFCGHNQKIDVQRHERLNSIGGKSCETCKTKYSAFNQKCVECTAKNKGVVYTKMRNHGVSDVEQDNKNKNTGCIIIVILFIVIVVIFGMTLTFISQTIADMKIEKMKNIETQYLINEKGEEISLEDVPIEKEKATDFIYKMHKSFTDTALLSLKLRNIGVRYDQYKKVNILKNDGKELNAEINKKQAEFNEIDTYNYKQLELIKKYMNDNYFKIEYAFLGAGTSAMVYPDTNNLNTMQRLMNERNNIPFYDIYLALTIYCEKIGARAGITKTEIEEIIKPIYAEYDKNTKIYEQLFTPDDKKIINIFN